MKTLEQGTFRIKFSSDVRMLPDDVEDVPTDKPEQAQVQYKVLKGSMTKGCTPEILEPDYDMSANDFFAFVVEGVKETEEIE